MLDSVSSAPAVIALAPGTLREEFEDARARAGGEEVKRRVDSANQIEAAADQAERALEYAVDSVCSVIALLWPFLPEATEGRDAS